MLEASWRPAADATGHRVVWTDTGTGATLRGGPSTSVTSSATQLLSGSHTYLVRVTPSNAAGDGPTASATTTASGRTA